VVQGLLLARSDANVAAGVMVSVGSCLVGFAGAKARYLISTGKPIRRFLTGGACIQGFLLAALTTLAIGGALTGIGAGELLDATTGFVISGWPWVGRVAFSPAVVRAGQLRRGGACGRRIERLRHGGFRCSCRRLPPRW
jgi:hypothetical protein